MLDQSPITMTMGSRYLALISQITGSFSTPRLAIVNAFQAGTIFTLLTGNPSPGYASQLIVNHIEDYGFLRYEMGYAAAVSVVLLLIVQLFSKVADRLFGERDDF